MQSLIELFKMPEFLLYFTICIGVAAVCEIYEAREAGKRFANKIEEEVLQNESIKHSKN